MGDDVDSAVDAFRRDSRPVAHRPQQVGNEVGERMTFQLGGQPLQNEVARVLLGRR